MEMLQDVYNTLGLLDFKVYLATRPEKRIGSEEEWDRLEKALGDALDSLKIPFEIAPGDGAFYGPKVEIHFVDAMKRTWQLGTIQADSSMPEKFDLSYVGEDNKEHRPLMLHRAVLGTLERFIGIYIEHTDGRFPLWLCPTQVAILNLTDRQADYCKELKAKLDKVKVRAVVDDRNEKLGYKIRENQLQKVPYMLIVGDKEQEQGKVSVRLKDGTTTDPMDMEQFLVMVQKEIDTKSLTNLIEA